jgi:hypothetical protein
MFSEDSLKPDNQGIRRQRAEVIGEDSPSSRVVN